MAGTRRFEGYLTLPNTAQPLANVTVVAVQDEREVSQPLLIVMRPGPLATVQASPGLVSAGEPVQVQAHFLTGVGEVFVLVGDARYPLRAEGPYHFRGEITAPPVADSYAVQLWADGELFATTRFRVAD